MLRHSVWISLILFLCMRRGKGATATSQTTQWEKARHVLTTFSDFFLGRDTSSYLKNNEKDSIIQGLSILGAGFPRTGTKSIEAALNKLGHRVYDPLTALERKHQQKWIQAAQDWKLRNDTSTLESLVQDMEEAGFTATLDMPLHMFVEPLAKLRPSAKVLLSIRDSTEQWYQSFAFINSIFEPLLYCRPWIWFIPDLKFNSPIIKLILDIDTINMLDNPRYMTHVFPWYDKIHQHPFLEDENTQQNWKTAYERRNKEIIDAFSADRLLVFNVKQGWEPLLDFLEIPIIENERIASIVAEGFPHVNDRQMLENVRFAFHVIAMGFPFWILLFASMVFLVVRALFRLISIVVLTHKKTPKEKAE
jgi:hypothetical protein